MTGRIVVVGLGPGGTDHVTAETLAAIERIPTRFLRTARHPSASLVPRRDDVRRPVRSGRHVRRRLRRDHRRAGRRRQRARRGPVRRARLAARARAHRAVPARAMRRRRDRRRARDPAGDVVPRRRLRAGSASIRSRPASDSSTVTSSPPPPPASAARCSSPTPTPTGCCRDIKLAVDGATGDEPVVDPAARSARPTNAIVTRRGPSSIARSRPTTSRRSTSPQLAAPVGAELRALPPARAHAARAVPVGHRADPPSRSCRTCSRRPTRWSTRSQALDPDDPTTDDAPDRGARRPALPDRVPRHDRRAGGSVHDRRRRRRRARQARPPPPARVRATASRRGRPAPVDGARQLGRRSSATRSSARRCSTASHARMPSLAYAAKVQRKAAKVGFDWPDVDGALPKIAEETAELRDARSTTATRRAIADELGDLLFAVVNVARHLDVDPELALRAATEKFRPRFEDGRATGRRTRHRPARQPTSPPSTPCGTKSRTPESSRAQTARRCSTRALCVSAS